MLHKNYIVQMKKPIEDLAFEALEGNVFTEELHRCFPHRSNMNDAPKTQYWIRSVKVVFLVRTTLTLPTAVTPWLSLYDVASSLPMARSLALWRNNNTFTLLFHARLLRRPSRLSIWCSTLCNPCLPKGFLRRASVATSQRKQHYSNCFTKG